MSTQNGLGHLCIVAQHFAHDAALIGPVRRGGFSDQWIAREFIEKGVELHVCFDLFVQRTGFDRSATGIEIGSPFVLRPHGSVLGGKSGGQAVQRCPQFVKVPHEADVER